MGVDAEGGAGAGEIAQTSNFVDSCVDEGMAGVDL